MAQNLPWDCQIEVKKQIELLQKKQEFEGADAQKKLLRAKEQQELAEVNSINQSDLVSLVKPKSEQKNKDGQTMT